MPTPKELYDEIKIRLDLNLEKMQMLEREIQQKLTEKNKLAQPIVEDKGALKQLGKLIDVEETVKSK